MLLTIFSVSSLERVRDSSVMCEAGVCGLLGLAGAFFPIFMLCNRCS